MVTDRSVMPSVWIREPQIIVREFPEMDASPEWTQKREQVVVVATEIYLRWEAVYPSTGTHVSVCQEELFRAETTYYSRLSQEFEDRVRDLLRFD
jgi:hypothetical protein